MASEQHAVPSVYEGVDMAGGISSSSAYWAAYEQILERDVGIEVPQAIGINR